MFRPALLGVNQSTAINRAAARSAALADILALPGRCLGRLLLFAVLVGP